jgi:predicted DCC family thiol-disulfide oxidoreductase YuxK
MTEIRPAIEPDSLTVLYDAECVVCRRARAWVERQRALVPVEFVPAGSLAALARFPALDVASTLTDVTVITNHGAVLRGDRGWIAVLWAVEPTRPTAYAIAQGRRRFLFRGVKGAAETVRRVTAGQPATASPTPWPAPTAHCDGQPCA